MIATPKSPCRPLRLIGLVALTILASGNLYAQQAVSISLKGSAEVPSVMTSAMGSAEIAVQPDRMVSGTIRTSGMMPTVAHIHEAEAGKNGPPIITLNKSSDGSFTVPAGSRLTDTQFASYLAGKLYVNVHSATYPDGEIRGQLQRTETAAAPKPAY